jgi:hypothetical protein
MAAIAIRQVRSIGEPEQDVARPPMLRSSPRLRGQLEMRQRSRPAWVIEASRLASGR